MALNLFINTAAADPRTAFVRGVASINAAQLPRFVIGDTADINIYLVDGVGSYDARSGAAGYTVRLGIGPVGGSPSGGTFTLTYGANTTSALAYDLSSSTLSTALNALASITADGGVTVTGTAPNFKVTWVSNGSRSNMTGSATLLTPTSAVVIDEVTAGDGSTQEVQMIRLRRTPAAFQDSWAQISNGWNADVRFDVFGIADLLGDDASVETTLEVEITDAGGYRITTAQAPVLIRNEVIDETAMVTTPLSSYLTSVNTYANFVQNRTGLSGLTGGSGYLDGITTAGSAAAVGWLASVLISGSIYFYRLESGTDAESSPDVIRPDDYATTTNERVWKLKGIASTGTDQFSYETPTTITAAGNTTLSIPATSEHHSAKLTVTDTYGGGSFTHTVTIPTTNATAGDVCEVRITLPASIDPTIEIRNATSGGTLLTTFAGQSNTTAIEAYGIYKYTGSAWVEFDAHYVD